MNQELQQGIAAAQAGQRDQARRLLLHVVENDERNEHAWLWLSSVMDDPDDVRTCLENVLVINPQHAQARAGLAWLNGQSSDRGAARATVVNPGVAHTEPPPAPPSAVALPSAAVAPETPAWSNAAATTTYPCMYCGTATAATHRRCPHCRNNLMIRIAPRETRSLALSVLAVLSGIGSVLSIISGGLLLLAGFLFSAGSAALKQQPAAVRNEMSQLPPGVELPGGMDIYQFIDTLGMIMYAIAFALLIGGVWYIFVTRGLWRRQRWAFIVAIVMSVLGGLYTCAAVVLALSMEGVALDLFSAGLQGVMIVLTALSYRDFFGPTVRYLPRFEWLDDVEHYNKGVAYRKRGWWHMVAREWEAAVAKMPANAMYLHGLSLAYAQLKQYDQARIMIERASQAVPHDRQIADSRALIERMAQGRAA